MNTELWWKVWMPLEGKGGGKWFTKEMLIQAKSKDEAEKICERVFDGVYGYLDDAVQASGPLTIEEVEAFRALLH